MRRLQRLLIWMLAVGLLAWTVSDAAWAQRVVRNGGGTTGTGFQYVIKFVCSSPLMAASIGLSSGSMDAQGGILRRVSPDLPRGSYFTDINIHNPNAKQVRFRKKVALDGEDPEHHGLQTSPVDVILEADEALEINCDDIRRLLGERTNL